MDLRAFANWWVDRWHRLKCRVFKRHTWVVRWSAEEDIVLLKCRACSKRHLFYECRKQGGWRRLALDAERRRKTRRRR